MQQDAISALQESAEAYIVKVLEGMIQVYDDVFCERQDANGFQKLTNVFFELTRGCLLPKQISNFRE